MWDGCRNHVDEEGEEEEEEEQEEEEHLFYVLREGMRSPCPPAKVACVIGGDLSPDMFLVRRCGYIYTCASLLSALSSVLRIPFAPPSSFCRGTPPSPSLLSFHPRAHVFIARILCLCWAITASFGCLIPVPFLG